MGYILGIDVGTQGTKGVFLNENLEIVAREYVEHSVSPMVHSGWMEHDAEEVWWGGFKRTLKGLLERVSFPTEEIIGIGCSALGPCMLPLSAKGAPLRPALMYSDARVEEEVREMREILGEVEITQTGKNSLSAQFVGPKVLWFKKNEPQKFKQTNKIFTASNYIVYRLTGEFILDYLQAVFFNPFYNYDKTCWDEETLERFEISTDLLPQLKNITDIAGKVTKEAASETGLAEGTPVIVSTIDGVAEAISSGSLKEGIATLLYGTTSVITVIVNKEITGPEELLTIPHPLLQDRNLVIGATATAGALTKWFRDNFGRIEKETQEKLGINAYKLLGQEAAQVPPGSEGLVVLPYFSGERTPINDALARGIIIGLTTYHSRAHIYRALLEGMAYAVQHHFEILENYGVKVSKVIASGGGTKSDLWVQIVSDVSGLAQTLLQTPTGAELGSAYLAGLATGIINNSQDLEGQIKEKSQKVKANKKITEQYRKYYDIYRGLYKKTKDDMHALAKLGERIWV